MKISLIILLTIFISCCELPNHRVAYFKITSLKFSPTTTIQANNEDPHQVSGPIPAADFAIQFIYDYERSGNGDAFEDGLTNLNPIVKFQIWSPQTFSGRAPNTSLNSLFKNRISSNKIVLLVEDGELEIRNFVISIHQQYLPKIAYLLPDNTSIAAGNYDLYFRSQFKDGSIILDSIMDIEIQ